VLLSNFLHCNRDR